MLDVKVTKSDESTRARFILEETLVWLCAGLLLLLVVAQAQGIILSSQQTSDDSSSPIDGTLVFIVTMILVYWGTALLGPTAVFIRLRWRRVGTRLLRISLLVWLCSLAIFIIVTIFVTASAGISDEGSYIWNNIVSQLHNFFLNPAQNIFIGSEAVELPSVEYWILLILIMWVLPLVSILTLVVARTPKRQEPVKQAHTASEEVQKDTKQSRIGFSRGMKVGVVALLVLGVLAVVVRVVTAEGQKSAVSSSCVHYNAHKDAVRTKPKTAALIFGYAPTTANVRVDGKLICPDPEFSSFLDAGYVPVTPGAHTVAISQDGLGTFRRTYHLDSYQWATVFVQLNAQKKAWWENNKSGDNQKFLEQFESTMSWNQGLIKTTHFPWKFRGLTIDYVPAGKNNGNSLNPGQEYFHVTCSTDVYTQEKCRQDAPFGQKFAQSGLDNLNFDFIYTYSVQGASQGAK